MTNTTDVEEKKEDEANEKVVDLKTARPELEEVEIEAKEAKEAEAETEISEDEVHAEDFKSKYYYLAAEMENSRKRFEREKQNLVKYGSEKILSGLIEVIDNLERTSDAISEEEEDEKIKNIKTGVEMVKKQFVEVLKNNGLKQVEAIGMKFDPNIHEAMAGQKMEGKENDDIITEFQKGYMLNGRLLRAAKVIIVNND